MGIKNSQKVNPLVIGILLVAVFIVGFFIYQQYKPELIMSRVKNILWEHTADEAKGSVEINSVYYDAKTSNCVVYATVKGNKEYVTMNLKTRKCGARWYYEVRSIGIALSKAIKYREKEMENTKEGEYEPELVESVESGDTKWELIYQE